MPMAKGDKAGNVDQGGITDNGIRPIPGWSDKTAAKILDDVSAMLTATGDGPDIFDYLEGISKCAKEAQKMKWQKKAPTEPGHYWFRTDGEIEVVRVHQYRNFAGEPCLAFTRYDDALAYIASDLKDGQFWSERISEPGEKAKK
jgi:hypothetical protein